MNILIVGEFSAFAKELKKGFVESGHECVIVSWGDGGKKVEPLSDDIDNKWILDRGRIIGILSRIWLNVKLQFKVHKLSKYWKADVVLIINPAFVRNPLFINHIGITKYQIKMLSKDSALIYLSACGTDYVYCKFYKDLPIISLYSSLPYYKGLVKKQFDRVLPLIKSVIPTHYDYAERYRLSTYSHNLSKTIPLPINVSGVKVYNEIKNDEIIIFLGKMKLKKGYEIMNKAVNIVVRKYPNVKRIPDKFLPLNEYFIELSKANILIDQCTGYSYGMNALFGMAMGKCVLTNNEPEGAKEYGLNIQDIPIVNIKENVDMIVAALEELINNPSLILDYGKRAREYVEKYHDSKVIAERYIEIFNSQ